MPLKKTPTYSSIIGSSQEPSQHTRDDNAYFSVVRHMLQAFLEKFSQKPPRNTAFQKSSSPQPYRSVQPDLLKSLVDVPQTVQQNLGLSYHYLSEQPNADEFINFYWTRIQYGPGNANQFWTELQEEWQVNCKSIILPDLAKNPACHLDFTHPYEILIEDFPEETDHNPHFEQQSLLAALCHEVEKVNPDLFQRRKSEASRLFAYSEVNQLITLGGEQTLLNNGFDPAHCKITNIPYEAYLMLAKQKGWGYSLYPTLTDKIIASSASWQVIVAGNLKEGPKHAETVCWLSPYVRHTARCSNSHSFSTVRLAIVPK